MKDQEYTLILKAKKMITPTVINLEFERQNGTTLDFIPGQFITFHFEAEGLHYDRSYSIATIPSKSHSIEIAVAPVPGGPATELLFSLKEGDEISATGPYGRLVLRDESPKRYILIATGTGISPYRTMLPELKRRLCEEKAEVVILFGTKTRAELFYGEDFVKYINPLPQYNFYACYSRGMPEQPYSYEKEGHVQDQFPNLNLNPSEDVIYLCGNPDMINSAFEILVERGFDTSQIRREKYISPKPKKSSLALEGQTSN